MPVSTCQRLSRKQVLEVGECSGNNEARVHGGWSGSLSSEEHPEQLLADLRVATGAALERARPMFLGSGKSAPAVDVHCDLRGSMAGQAVRLGPGHWKVRFNPVLAAANRQAFMDEVVPHEVAHVVAVSCAGRRIRPHGPEWQAAMRALGITEPRRCHAFAVPDDIRRRQRRWSYRCGCRDHDLSTTRHNRVQRGVAYYCRLCGDRLVKAG